ncbi:hypothetical protein AB0M22_09315 [Nocardia sp. NPDC051756]|uniref:hypothetical protein n=1 Tax=Nocardia sp. NPDC051756 TaxID=3154751 RepID=UPI003441D9A9
MSSHREAAQSALNARDFAAANVHALLYLADEQRMANLIAARKTGVPLTGYQQQDIEAFVRGQLDRIEAGR